MKVIGLWVLAAAVVLAGCEAASPTAVQPGRSHAPSFTGTGACAPRGSVVVWSWNYDWIANGQPTSGNCWNLSNASFVTGTTTCGTSTNAIAFAYSGSMSQEFTIPAGWTQSHFTLNYDLDFIDPHDDGAWNRFTMTVTDLTTGATLASDSFFGNSGSDLSCAPREKKWTGNLAGHTLRVRMTGSRGYTDTHIRVRRIVLWQE